VCFAVWMMYGALVTFLIDQRQYEFTRGQLGWIIGAPIPLLLMWAPSWGWIVFANVLLGVNQGLTWSTTVIMKIDLVGPARRGFAMGLNEAAGYGAVAVTALATGYIAEHAGLRPEPFFLGLAYAGLGLALSTVFVKETHAHARHEAANHVPTSDAHHEGLSTGEVFRLTSFQDKALSSCSQAGLVNNLNDGVAWGLFPIFFADAGLSIDDPTVDGSKQPRWGPYRPDHIYTVDRVGGGSPITAKIHDVAPSNNTGALSIEIYEN